MAGDRVRAWLDRAPDDWSPPTARDLTGPFAYLFWLIRQQGRQIALGTTLGSCWMIGLAFPPWVLSRVVDRGLVAGDSGALVGWSLLLLGIGIVNALLGIGRHRTMTKIRMDGQFRSVRATVWHTSRLGASLSRRLGSGEVVTVGIGDVQTVAMALTVTGPGVGAVIAYAVVAVVLFTISPLLAAVILAGVPLLVFIVGPLLQRIERTTGDYRVQQAQLTTRLVDALAGLAVLNGLGGKPLVAQKFDLQSQELVQRGYRVAGPSSWVGALSGGLPALFLAAVVWLSARMAVSGRISLGDVVAVYGYVAMLVIPVANFIEGAGDIARARVAGRRIVDLLRLPVPQDSATADERTPPEQITDGELRDPVSGAIIRPGLFTAVVAARPADAVRVLERLGRVQGPAAATERPSADGGSVAREVTWGGVPIDRIGEAEFRRRVLLADNDAEIFAGTVREIVAGWHGATDELIKKAIQVAVANDIVDALPNGLDTPIAAGGHDLSGGQRQRLRLARAVYGRPEVLLAVEPTSAVDANTEAIMINRLREDRQSTTTVIATTSPLVLDQVDEVIVVQRGTVTAVGTHVELLHSSPSYRALVSRSQQESTAQNGTDQVAAARTAGGGR